MTRGKAPRAYRSKESRLELVRDTASTAAAKAA